MLYVGDDMKILSKDELYDLVHRLLGEALHIPPIEYCFMQRGEQWQSLGFNCGDVLIIYTRSYKKSSVTIVDEWSHRTFTNVEEIVNFVV